MWNHCFKIVNIDLGAYSFYWSDYIHHKQFSVLHCSDFDKKYFGAGRTYLSKRTLGSIDYDPKYFCFHRYFGFIWRVWTVDYCQCDFLFVFNQYSFFLFISDCCIQLWSWNTESIIDAAKQSVSTAIGYDSCYRRQSEKSQTWF